MDDKIDASLKKLSKNMIKRNFSIRKWKTKNKFTGKRKKSMKKKHNDVVDVNLNDNMQTDRTVSPPNEARPSTSTATTAEIINNMDQGEQENEIYNFVSASKFKLKGFHNFENVSNDYSIIVSMGSLNELVNKGSVCMHCKQHSLSINEYPDRRKGLASVLKIVCSNVNCDMHNLAPIKTYSSTKVKSGLQPTFETGKRKSGSSRLPFIINLKAVLAARAIGIGHSQLFRLCAIMGLPKPLHKKSFKDLQNQLHKAAVSAMRKNFIDVAAEVKKQYAELFGSQSDANTHYEPGNVGVMFDGTWQKRGHKSHNGVGVAIDIQSGYVLDVAVLSNYCVACHKGPKEEDATFNEWMLQHSPNCQKNIDCSSHAMEVEAALKIWERSNVSELKYTTFLSDGDSKAYTAVSNMKPYGDTTTITKEDCVNHVSKRFGTALRKVNPDLPRGSKLSDTLIRTLSFYYQLALVNNKGDATKMYHAVLATLLHCSSNADSSNHRLCPKGSQSWCPFQKAAANKKDPPVHEPRLNEIQAKALMPIYKRMSDPELLKRCVEGKTQNAAESFNSRVWNLCPKTRFASLSSVETAVALSVLQFNKGMAGLSDILQELNIEIDVPLTKYRKTADDARIKQMQHKMTAAVRQTRKAKKLEDAKQSDRLRQREGLTYYPGGLDTGMFD